MCKLFVISAILAVAIAAPEAKPHYGGSLSGLPQHPVGVPQVPVGVRAHLPLDVPARPIEVPAYPVGVPSSLPVGVRAHFPVEYDARPVQVQAPIPAVVRSFEGPAPFPAVAREAVPFGVHQYGHLVHQGPVLRQPFVGYPEVRHY